MSSLQLVQDEDLGTTIELFATPTPEMYSLSSMYNPCPAKRSSILKTGKSFINILLFAYYNLVIFIPHNNHLIKLKCKKMRCIFK